MGACKPGRIKLTIIFQNIKILVKEYHQEIMNSNHTFLNVRSDPEKDTCQLEYSVNLPLGCVRSYRNNQWFSSEETEWPTNIYLSYLWNWKTIRNQSLKILLFTSLVGKKLHEISQKFMFSFLFLLQVVPSAKWPIITQIKQITKTPIRKKKRSMIPVRFFFHTST